MGIIIDLLRTAWSFLGKKTNLLGATGVPILVWVLAGYGAYSLALDSKDTVFGLFGMDSTSVAVRNKTKDALEKAANDQLATTLDIVTKNNEDTITAVTEAGKETEAVSKDISELLSERDRLMKDLLAEQTTESGVTLFTPEGSSPFIPYKLDIKDNDNDPVVTNEEENTGVVCPPQTTTQVVISQPTKKSPSRNRIVKQNLDIGTYSKKYDSGNAKINIRTLWSAYHIASNTAKGVST